MRVSAVIDFQPKQKGFSIEEAYQIKEADQIQDSYSLLPVRAKVSEI
jgi:hypothetical protein